MHGNFLFRVSTAVVLVLSAASLSSCGKTSTRTASGTLTQELAPPPLLTIELPPVGTFITTTNYFPFTMSGICGYEGGTVVVTEADLPFPTSTICTANTWSVSMDVSFIFDGLLTFNVSHTGPLGETTIPISRDYIKDTLAPSGASIIIGDGVTIPTSPSVVLNLGAVGATKMYITNSAGCSTGGVLEPYATTKNWTLQAVASMATVYAIYSDDAGNSSACVSATTAINYSAPLVSITGPAAGTQITLANVANFNLSGTCSEEGVSVVIGGDVTSSTACVGHAWSSVLNLTALPEGTVDFTATQTNSSNISGMGSASYLKNTVPAPGPLVISPASISLSSSAAQSTTFTASGGTLPYVFTVISGNGTINSSTGVYSVAAGATGTTLIRVADSAAHTADAVITHTNAINLAGCYKLQIIGMKTKSAELTDSNRRSLFISMDKTSKILLSDGPFKVLDGNGTDGSAALSLPTSGYTVYLRLVGKPGGKIDPRTCAVDPLDPTVTYCSQTTLSIDRFRGTPNAQDVSQDLLNVSADIDGDGVADRVPLFSPSLDGYFWKVDSVSRVHAQLKFCPISL